MNDKIQNNYQQTTQCELSVYETSTYLLGKKRSGNLVRYSVKPMPYQRNINTNS
jgi:hypothetical protein